MEHFLKRLNTLESSEQNNERHIAAVQEILRSVHEEALFGLIADELQKAGVDSEQLRQLIPISEVVVKESVEDYNGSYTVADGITVYAGKDTHIRLTAFDKFKSERTQAELREDFTKETPESLQILENDDHPLFVALRTIGVVKTLIHEELHALTDAGVSTYEHMSDQGFSIGSTSRVGLERTYQSSVMNYDLDQEPNRQKSIQFTALNEAVTEIKARKLARAYLKSYPPAHVSSREIDFVFDAAEGSYTDERFVCEQLFIILAAIAEVPEDVIENAFFKAYLENEHVLPLELIGTLSENCPALNGDDIEELLSKLETALKERVFDESSDVHKIFAEVIAHLPEEKQHHIKDALIKAFKKYNPQ